jgi:GAF domain-containing protein
MGLGLSGWVAENNKTILNGNPTVEPGFVEDPASPLRSALAVPIGSLHGVTGVLALYRRDRDAFSTSELRVLHVLGAKVGQVLEEFCSSSVK